MLDEVPLLPVAHQVFAGPRAIPIADFQEIPRGQIVENRAPPRHAKAVAKFCRRKHLPVFAQSAVQLEHLALLDRPRVTRPQRCFFGRSQRPGFQVNLHALDPEFVMKLHVVRIQDRHPRHAIDELGLCRFCLVHPERDDVRAGEIFFPGVAGQIGERVIAGVIDEALGLFLLCRRPDLEAGVEKLQLGPRNEIAKIVRSFVDQFPAFPDHLARALIIKEPPRPEIGQGRDLELQLILQLRVGHMIEPFKLAPQVREFASAHPIRHEQSICGDGTAAL